MISSIKNFFKAVIFDPINNLQLQLKSDGSVPVAIQDPINGLQLELEADGSVPVAIFDPINSLQLELEPDGSVPVALQDQHSTPLILPMVREIVSNTLAVDAVVDAYTITLTSAVGFVVGQHIRIIIPAGDRYYFGTILVIAVNVITVGTPMDYAYLAGSEVTGSDINMNVDGSVTPVIFTLRTGSPSIPSSVDITRLLIVCTASSAVDLNKFGNLASLTRGIVFRKVDGVKTNYFNARSNSDLAAIGYDFTSYQASNPAHAVDGFVFSLTFAGQEKLGVALRIEQSDNLEMIIQDDLTGLTSLNVILEGHVVQ